LGIPPENLKREIPAKEYVDNRFRNHVETTGTTVFDEVFGDTILRIAPGCRTRFVVCREFELRRRAVRTDVWFPSTDNYGAP
jgi:hypothetical protein